MPSGNTKKRDYLFDNYKALLIALVVIGHFIELSYKDNEFLYALKWLVVSFHMPAFIFISGYFSKRTLSLGILFQKLAIPYFIYEIIYYLVYTFIIHKPTGLYLLYPKFSLWYIQALFFWRLLAPHIRKIPHYMAISILAGLLAGCLDMPDNFLTIPRTLVFFPYFLAGSAFDRSLLVRMRTLKNRMIACAGVAAFACFLAFDPFHRNLSPKIFYGRYNYDYLDQSIIEGVICRVICYGIGFAMTLAVALLMSGRRTFYSYIGTRTMAIYLFHGLAYSYLKGCTDLLRGIDTLSGSLLLILSCLLMTAAFSIPQLTTFTNAVSSLRLPRALRVRQKDGTGKYAPNLRSI